MAPPLKLIDPIGPHPYLVDVCCVPLLNGGHALIDAEDCCRVDEFRWEKHYNKTSHTWYATAKFCRNGKQSTVQMHRLLFGLTREDRIEVDHKNHDGLDNRRNANLRLASRSQNTTNCRVRQNSSSIFKGVSWLPWCARWRAKIAVNSHVSVRHVSLGVYKLEEEAAYAYSVAAPLIQDPEFACPTPIPAERMPTEARMEEIRSVVIGKLKAKSENRKGRLAATSSYAGVSFFKAHSLRTRNAWISRIISNGTCYQLGGYATEIEAAYAFDCGILALNLSSRTRNHVSPEDLGSPERAAEIERQVRERIRRY